MVLSFLVYNYKTEILATPLWFSLVSANVEWLFQQTTERSKSKCYPIIFKTCL